MRDVPWSVLKNFLTTRSISAQATDLGDRWWLVGVHGPFSMECMVAKTDPVIASSEQEDFETNFLSGANQSPKSEVTTQMEKDDKSLKTFNAYTVTDANGEAEFCIPIPADGRWIAYGDAEFETRTMGDYVKTLELTDLDRLIAWQIALSIDPLATAPVSDATAQANGYPDYPALGFFDERDFPATMPANARGTIRGGMAMTFAYGTTEAVPVGGYAHLPGGFYFRVIVKKATNTAGIKCQISVDWAKPS